MNQELQALFSARTDSVLPVPDSDIEAIAAKVIEKMRPDPNKPVWQRWSGNMTTSHNSLKRKSKSDLEKLGFSDEFAGMDSPAYVAGMETTAARLSAALERRARSISKQITKGRLLTSFEEAGEMVRSLESSGVTRANIVRLAESASSQAREAITKTLLEQPDGRKVKGIYKEARTIARDEILSTNSAVTKLKMEALGLATYEWISQRDGKVRSNHVMLDGTKQAFSLPPLGGGTGPSDTGNPGDGINCRCGAFPIVE